MTMWMDRAQLFDQHGRLVVDVQLNPFGWTPVPSIHAGFWQFGCGLVFWNACPGAGELFFSKMVLFKAGSAQSHDVLPCWRWTNRSGKLVIGGKDEYIAPRGSLRIRWGYDHLLAPKTVRYGPATVTWSETQRRDMFRQLANSLLRERFTGISPCYGDSMVDPPGAALRGGVAGCEQDAWGLALRSDCIMNRTNLGCLSQETGMPISLKATNPDYEGTRGFNKATQLVEFSRALTPWDDSRLPIVTLSGTSSYRDLMLGVDRAHCMSAFDNQHLGCATYPVRGAMQCGDPIAIFDGMVLANESAQCKATDTALPWGSRGRAWAMDAMAHARSWWYLAEYGAHQTVVRQMVNGGFLRAPSATYNFNPPPSKYGMPLDMDVDAIMERVLTCYAIGGFGHLEQIKKAALSMPWPTVKFVAVGRNQTEVFDTYQFPCGETDYFGDLLLGVLAVLEPNGTDWRELALRQPIPNGGVYPTLRDRMLAMRTNIYGREQSAMLLSVLEQVLA